MASSEIVDIEELILNWAKQYKFHKDVKSKINLDDLRGSDINFKKLIIRHKTPDHKVKEDPKEAQKKPKSYVLFSSIFHNDTNEDQSYTLKSERKTRSSCKVTLTKVLSVGATLSLQLTPPNPVIQANAGFRTDFSLTKSRESNFEEELTWSLESQVKVPAHYRTTAELEIKEDEYDGSFLVETEIEGKINVNIRSSSDGNILTTITAPDLSQVFKREHGFTHVDVGKVTFMNSGFCFCRYGIEQQVKLKQAKITEVSENDA